MGCGRGRHAHALALHDNITTVAMDLNQKDVAAARDQLSSVSSGARLHATVADIYRIPCADETFDIVICSEVLEHLFDVDAALAEIARVLKPGGQLAISVPRQWPESVCWKLAPAYAQEPGGHVRIFNANQLKRAVIGKGFQSHFTYHAHSLHSPYWWLKCAFWSRRDTHPMIRAYQRFLEWDILKKPLLTKALDAALNPVCGKSVVMHFERTPAR